MRTLPAEIALLYLCAHGAKHRWNRLCRVVDVAQQLRAQPAVDWEGLLITAKLTGSSCRTLFLGMQLAHLLFGADFTAEVWTQLNRDVAAQALARDICGSLFFIRNSDCPEGFRLAGGLVLSSHEGAMAGSVALSPVFSRVVFPAQPKGQGMGPIARGSRLALHFHEATSGVACTLVAPRSGKRC